MTHRQDHADKGMIHVSVGMEWMARDFITLLRMALSLKHKTLDFPDGPVLKILCCRFKGHGLDPGPGTKVLHVVW